MKKLVWKYLSITVASIIYSCGVSSFIDANNFAPGGVSGLCISLNRLIPLEIGTLFFLLNIPILILGLWKFGWKFIASTLYEIVLISGFSNWFSTRGAATADPILGALFGGTLIAVGMGIAFKCRATTGGMDIIVKVIKQKFPYLKTGTIFLLADAIVIGFGGIVFQNLNAIFYSVLAEVVTSRVLDLILYGTDGAKLLYIISDHSEQIAERILTEIDSGVTYLEGKGAYQNTDKKVILCVIRKQSMQKMEDIVRMEDENAFMIVSSASEIYGEGYKSYFMEKL